jgi:hypothetical protein
VVVYDANGGTRLGTAIDVLVLDHDNKRLALEIKAGYHGTWTVAEGFMQAPLAHIPNTPQNRAFLQLALSMRLARSSLRHPVSRAYVVQVEVDGVFVYELPQWSVDAMDTVIASLRDV